MKRATAKALEQSIEHWERLTKGKEGPDESIYGDCCALCTRFGETCERTTPGGEIERCPIYERTGKSHCSKTPWHAAEEAWCNMHWSMWDGTVRETREKAFRRAAHKMLKFLKSLREE